MLHFEMGWGGENSFNAQYTVASGSDLCSSFKRTNEVSRRHSGAHNRTVCYLNQSFILFTCLALSWEKDELSVY